MLPKETREAEGGGGTKGRSADSVPPTREF